ncbi:hypothetical protein, partial [Nocardia gipuzkoensis]|uniref:hypothetical protein n=1 Tax=Nocardia gipuzkoensis TaxID=2749991 RepID=UPI00245384DB
MTFGGGPPPRGPRDRGDPRRGPEGTEPVNVRVWRGKRDENTEWPQAFPGVWLRVVGEAARAQPLIRPRYPDDYELETTVGARDQDFANRRSEKRTCPVCGRRNALIKWDEALDYCRWSRDG